MPAAGRLLVDVEALDPRRPLVGAEVDPDAVDLGPPALIALQRPAPPGRDRGQPARPGHEPDLVVAEERLVHVDSEPPHEPEVRRRAPPRLLDVVDRDVLQQPRDRVEPDASARVDVREADAPPRRERPSGGGDRDARVEHGSVGLRVRHAATLQAAGGPDRRLRLHAEDLPGIGNALQLTRSVVVEP